MNVFRWILAPTALVLTVASTPPTLAQPADAGAKVFKQRCATCHGLGAMAAYSPGPALAGVYKRPVASVPGYEYSPALKKIGGTWTESQLDSWLKDPAAFAPGSAMPQGAPDPLERADLIGFLKTLK